MEGLIVGASIISQGLIKGGKSGQLKHSTYDLTIGKIFPIGADTKSAKTDFVNGHYFLQPRQAVLVLSKEEFALPGTVTGLATLRTTLTKNGLLALNVGIIDPYFNGPISTTLINFSDRTVPINIGMPFFRVLFIEHSKTKKGSDESKEYSSYADELTISAYRDFPKSFLNIPNLDNKFFAETAWKMLKGATIRYFYIMVPAWLFIISLVLYVLNNENYWKFMKSFFKGMKEVVPFF